MDDQERMYGALKRAQQHPGMYLTLPSNDPEGPLVEQLLTLGLLETVPGASDYESRTVKLTAEGMRAVARANAAGQRRIEWTAPSPAIHIEQHTHGTSHTQIGDGNVMNIQHHAQDPAQMLQGLQALRALVVQLPGHEQEEASAALNQAEQAVKNGRWDKVKTYGGILLTLGLQSVEFAKKVKELFGGG